MKILSERQWHRMIDFGTGLFAAQPRAIGIDVGTRFVKTVVLNKTRHGLALAEFSIQAVDEQPSQHESSYPEWTKLLKKTLTVPGGIIGSSLSGPSVLIKSLSLPVMTEEEIR
ncbi:MAG: hypothetical protein OEZ05_16210, partial [Nitrospirota bacterium]|nr:hypothetical protein [Nitrospirota bacterium]